MDYFKLGYILMIIIGVITLIYHKQWGEEIISFQANVFKIKMTSGKKLYTNILVYMFSFGVIALGIYDLIRY